MSAKHTPGPWKLNTARMGDKLLDWHIAADPHGSSLPVCLSDKYSEFRNAEQEIANAHLIAAAPELLEALKDAVSMLDDLKFRSDADQEGAVTEQIREANSAIAKATGDQP
jgi:hypothetical protein